LFGKHFQKSARKVLGLQAASWPLREEFALSSMACHAAGASFEKHDSCQGVVLATVLAEHSMSAKGHGG